MLGSQMTLPAPNRLHMSIINSPNPLTIFLFQYDIDHVQSRTADSFTVLKVQIELVLFFAYLRVSWRNRQVIVLKLNENVWDLFFRILFSSRKHSNSKKNIMKYSKSCLPNAQCRKVLECKFKRYRKKD